MTEKTVRPAEKPEEEKSPEEQARADAIDMRCLSLCIGMLERVNGVRRLWMIFESQLTPPADV